MARRPALVSLLACIPLLVGQPAIADMVIEVTNYSRIQVGVAVSGSNIVTHLLPGGPPHAFPASGESRTVEVVLGDNSTVCRGQAVVTAAAGQSFCQWVDGGGTAGLAARCLPAASGNGTSQCRVSIRLEPTD